MDKAFDLKNKGQTWHDDRDLIEMLSLNRILRVNPHGLL